MIYRVGQIGRRLAGPAGLAAILAVIFVSYLGTIDDWFTSDDFFYLRAAQTASYPAYILNAFNFTEPGPVPEFLYRPLYVSIFPVFYQLFGLNAGAYHLLGILVHLANASLVWLIGYRLSRRLAVAHIAAFVFGLHPTYAPAVAWITNNVAIFAMFFALSSLLLFLKYLDGGATRSRYYGASFLALLIALLLHPESMTILAIMGLSFALLYPRRPGELWSARAWAPIVPHMVLGVFFFGLYLLVREDNFFQLTSFRIGPHIYENYLHYSALAGNPFGVGSTINLDNWETSIQLENWRTIVPIIGVLLISVYLLVTKRSHSRTLAVLWFYLALLPLSTWLAGAQPRKLYVAGPAFALMIALTAVSFWDWAATRRPVNGYRTPVLVFLPLIAVGVFGFVLSLQTSQMIDPPHMARATLTGLSGESYQEMVNQVRQTYPSLPEESRLDLVGQAVPILFGALDPRMVAAVRLYYGEIEVVGAKTLEGLPPLPGHLHGSNFVVVFECPPLCPGQ